MGTIEIPDCKQLKLGIDAFQQNERRGYIYSDALSHISKNWGDPNEMAIGIKKLLDILHQTFYRFGNFLLP